MGDKRTEDRRRTRLRSGKVANLNGVFITECVIHDLSAIGARLRVDDCSIVPEEMLLLEDATLDIVGARVAWRREHELGVQLVPGPIGDARKRIVSKLSGKYYAL
jgi:hypothetical protein